MSYAGIDLAADPRRTGVAVISSGSPIRVESVIVGADDDDVLHVIDSAEKAGVDVPVGWPDPFVQLISDHAEHGLTVPSSTGPDWRRNLAMRTTDIKVRERTGRVPLSVSTDRIAYPALRWAGIEARLRAEGVDAARDGSGRVCEVYPAAALSCWTLPSRGYKGTGSEHRRTEIVDRLSVLFPELSWNGHDQECIHDDNALDAVVSALMARAVATGKAVGPPEGISEIVRREGWIWLPMP